MILDPLHFENETPECRGVAELHQPSQGAVISGWLLGLETQGRGHGRHATLVIADGRGRRRTIGARRTRPGHDGESDGDRAVGDQSVETHYRTPGPWSSNGHAQPLRVECSRISFPSPLMIG